MPARESLVLESYRAARRVRAFVGRRVAGRHTASSKQLAEEYFSDSAFIDAGNQAALFKSNVPVPGLRFRFLGLRGAVEGFVCLPARQFSTAGGSVWVGLTS